MIFFNRIQRVSGWQSVLIALLMIGLVSGIVPALEAANPPGDKAAKSNKAPDPFAKMLEHARVKHQKAAEAGNVDAQFALGDAYANATATPDNHKAALKWLRKSAEQGHPGAQSALGMMYYMGFGVAEDNEQAASWFEKAAKQGNTSAQKYLGMLYSRGQGVKKNMPTALRLLSQAAAGGDIDARSKMNRLRGRDASASMRPLVSTQTGADHLVVLTSAKKLSKKTNVQARNAASRGDKAFRKGDVAEALAFYLKAHKISPRNEMIARNAGLLSVRGGQKEQAVDLFRKANELAVKARRFANVAFYNEQVVQLLDQDPVWAIQQMAGLNSPPNTPEGRTAYNEWVRLSDHATRMRDQGQNAAALPVVREALKIARNILGNDSLFALYSLRDLATLHQLLGQKDLAESQYKTAVKQAQALLTPRHPETLAIQIRLADLYESLNRYAESEEIYKDVQGHYIDHYGANHPDALAVSRAITRLYENQGRYDAANGLLATVCRVTERTFGKHHAETARCYAQHAALNRQWGHLDVAEKKFQHTLDLQHTIFGPNAVESLATQADLAELERIQGHYEQARDRLQETLQLIQKHHPANKALLRNANSRLAELYTTTGDLNQAEALLGSIHQEESVELGENDPDTLATLTSLAGIYKRQGRFPEAEATYRESLTRYEKTLGADHPATIVALNNLGLVLENQGLYDQAEPFFTKAYAKARKVLGNQHTTTLASANNLALLHESQGVFDKAEPLYKQSIYFMEKKLGESHPDTLAMVNNLAYLYMLQAKYDKSEPLFSKAVLQWTKVFGLRHQTTLKGLNNLGRVNHHMNRLDKADEYISKALTLRKEVLGPRHMDVIRSTLDLGVLRVSQKRLDEAQKVLTEALELAEKVLGPQHPYTFETLNALADLHEARKDSAAALKLREEIFQRRTVFLDRMMWVTGDNAREGYVRLHRPELNDYLALLSSMDAGLAGQKALEIGLQRKGLLLKVTSEVQRVAELSNDPQLGKLSKDLNATRKKLASLTLSGPSGDDAEQHLMIINALEEKVDILEMELGRASQRFRQSKSQPTLDQLLDNMADGSVLVDFLIYSQDDESKLIAAVAVKENGTPQYQLVQYEDLEEINDIIHEYREIIQDEDADEDEQMEVGMIAYEKIWQPLESVVGALNVIYVVPDGMLNILPFNAMVDGEEEYLIRSLDIHILTTSRDVLPSLLAKATGDFMILAGPNYDSTSVSGDSREAVIQQRRSARRSANVQKQSAETRGAGTRAAELLAAMRGTSSGMRGLNFDPLPGAEKEGRLITEEIVNKGGKNKIFLQDKAQEQLFRDMKTPPKMLHVATHGFFLKAEQSLKKRLMKLQRGADLHIPPPGDNPLLRAGLAFAGINANAKFLGEIDTDNDGVLTALEVLNLNLTGTELAVLSACETGLGEIHEGEGVYGLRRAFQEAGVQSVINSLWEVSDAGTQALMTSLYGRLVSGQTPHDALRESQLEMLDSSEWAYPYIWSAFFMVGK
ncbi:MAG: tetratricopeptide repeat protein [Magnetococcales bacterium]|nr:tetratricopeptide repeat protein [Magnetococcales bacterium]